MTLTPSKRDGSGFRNAISILAALLVVVFLFVLYYAHLEGGDHANHVDLKGGYQVITSSASYEDADLSTLVFEMQNRGDVIDLYHVMPDILLMDPVLVLNSVHSMVEVFLENELIYSYGREFLDRNIMLGFGNHYISLSEDYVGKMLHVRYTFTENNAINYLDEIQLYNGNFLYRDYIIDNKLDFAVDVSLVVYGLFFMFVFLFFSLRDRRYTRLMNIAIFALCIGTWSLCNSNYIFMFTYNLREKALLEYWTLYTAPLVLLLYFFNEPEYLSVKWIRGAYYLVFAAQLAFIIIVGLGTSIPLNLFHLPDALTYAHILILIEFLVMMSMCISRYLRFGKKRATLVWAMMAMLCFTAYDLVLFNLHKYVEAIIDKHFTSISALGIFIFVFAIMLDFVQVDMDAARQKVRADTLNELAYKDALTGCKSRRWFDETVDRYPDKDWYGIIMYDLNYLKSINDNRGHVAGDRFLVEFSGILKSVFGPYASVARTGGDEFCVLFKKGTMVDAYALMKKADEEMEKSSNPEEGYIISAAKGYVDRGMYPDKKLGEACKIADKLMYQNKENTKHGRD